tara:strand:- start:1492 stop:1767 length:276 start_codon:yes stop_codon:yes gene_type:complete
MRTLTNHHWRDFLYQGEVPAEVIAEDYDHLTEDYGLSDGWIKYRGEWSHISDYMSTPLNTWHGVHTDTFFSCTVIKLSDDGEQYQIGRIYS